MALPANPVLYAQVSDLKLALQGADDGVGTAAGLSSTQLEQALIAASNRVSVYAGGVYDSSEPSAIPPAIFYDLTLSLAAYFATAMYLKQKELLLQHPSYVRYTDAMKVLQDARDGKVRLDVETAGSINSETGIIINRIPRIFNHEDSNTRINPVSGELEAASPFSQWIPGWAGLDDGGPEYQG